MAGEYAAGHQAWGSTAYCAADRNAVLAGCTAWCSSQQEPADTLNAVRICPRKALSSAD